MQVILRVRASDAITYTQELRETNYVTVCVIARSLRARASTSPRRVRGPGEVSRRQHNGEFESIRQNSNNQRRIAILILSI